MKLILTCEHAGNEIPQEYEHLFHGQEEVLKTHRGFDPGAFDLYSALKNVADFCHFQEVSRLLIEVNRSLHHPALFSEFSGKLSSEEKQELITKVYLPYRNKVEVDIIDTLQKGEKIIHFSVHSFTNVLDGMQRNADIGLLYDPAHNTEKKFSADFKAEILKEAPGLKIRFNYPYIGKADGFTTYLRKKYPQNYSGIELEVNQKFVRDNQMDSAVKKVVLQALIYTLAKSAWNTSSL
ncbi:N-formylglutamate amidohydrolase [Salinimicrobium sp. GXAS 041]|uniref:N-formylglutamate amidohydrolase n=1 Tax=Salinimicrobium sp. GXAS 041 TaxID=3400806 RepID=UPI003C78D322